MKKIKAGDKVRCIDPYNGDLLKNRSYCVLVKRSDNGNVSVANLAGKEIWGCWYSSRFEKVKPNGKKK